MGKTRQAAMTPSRRAHDLVDHLTNSLASKTRYWSALAASREHGWWVLLIASLTELAIGLSVAGSLKAPIMTLLTWITAGTLVHGIGEIASAFLVRGIGRHVAARQ
jgi:uncharacterized membrane protein HdeD (DUF308 family)